MSTRSRIRGSRTRTRRRHVDRTPRRGGAKRDRLAAIVDEQRRLLTAGVLSAGLARVRGRSAPDRLAREADEFVDLLALALDGRDTAPALRAQVRTGALAAASAEEIGDIFEVWRRAVHPLLASITSVDATARADRALDELQREALAAGARWSEDRLDVIAVAASAGGLAALARLLEPVDPGAAATWLVVLHVSPRTPSLVASVLARQVAMPISAAVDGGALQLGSAHVAPPGWHLVVTGGTVRLLDGPPVHFVKPSADVLFESAAAAYGRHVASIVLSGTGADGATGTRIVREHGGITFAQDPQDADFDGMPAAAVATGDVEHVLPLGKLAQVVARAALHGRASIDRA